MIAGLTSAAQIRKIAETVIAQNYDFEYIGLRVQESDYGLSVGQKIEHLSRHWIDGDMTDDDLDGICAISAQLAVERTLSFGFYIGTVIVVLGSNGVEYGEDDGEIILKSAWGHNPTVLDIIRL